MHLDSTIRLGDLVLLAGMIGSVLVAWFKIGTRLSLLEQRVADLWNWWTHHWEQGYMVELKPKAKAHGQGD